MQQQQPTGGMFGNTSTSGGGLFGTPAPGAGLFGTTGAANTAGGIFGNKPAGSIFGNTTGNDASAANPPSLFSGSQPQQQPQQQQQQQTANFFAQPAQQQRPAGTLFGTAPAQSQSTSSPSGGNLFGTSTLGASALGSSAAPNALLSSRSNASAPQQQNQDAQAQFSALTQRIEALTQAWTPSSPQCRFQHYFYNLVDPNQVSLYGRPPNATNDALWQKAVRENPDPSCLVPVIAAGFDDLQQRVGAQSQQAAAHQEKLKELKTRIESLSQRHSLSNATRLQRASAIHTQTTHRLLSIITHLHLLIPSVRSSAIRPEEERLRSTLDEIEEEVRRGKGRGRLNELWALVGAVNAAKERGRRGAGVGATGDGTEWAVVDDEGLAQIAQILSEQQAGLAHLTKILQGDLKDLDVVLGNGSLEADDEGERLFSSGSTLRASHLH